ncbi:MAG: LysR family transcriptional regulator, partial [Deltaproteobacteria bacterium]|nr:LysR family transcriptional regulator [Deltaproteobacteria bacterium]
MYQQASGDFLQWLQTFLTVAETGNIHRAAVLCGLSPSAASLHIKKLEQDLDLKLFARQSKGMTLTQAGRQFKEASVPILESVGKLRKHKLKQPALSGSVRITCINHLALFFMPDVIEFCRLHPNVQLNFDTASPRRVVRNIEEGIFDLAAGIHEQLPGSLRFIPFRPSSAFLYTPPGNPFNLPAVPSWDEICSLPFIALTVEGYV